MERKTNSLDKHMAGIFLWPISMPSIQEVSVGQLCFTTDWWGSVGCDSPRQPGGFNGLSCANHDLLSVALKSVVA